MSSSDEEIVLTRSSRRTTTARSIPRDNKRDDVLAKIREAKNRGEKFKPDINTFVKDVYEEVDEEEYQKIVQGRSSSEFVVDDTGTGDYMDLDRDIDEEEEYNDKFMEKKVVKKFNKPGVKSIKSFFNTSVKGKVKDEKSIKLDNDDVLMGLLKELDDEKEEKETVVCEVPSKNPFKRPLQSPLVNDKPPKVPKVQPYHSCVSTSVSKVEVSEVKESISIVQKDCNTAIQNDDFMDDFDDPSFDEVLAKNAKVQNEVPIEKVQQVESITGQNVDEQFQEFNNPEVDITHFNNEQNLLKELDECDMDDTKKKGRQIYFHYLDAYEDPVKYPSSVYLFGRIHGVKGISRSTCIKLTNIEKQIFFAPRRTRLVNGGNTETPVTFAELHEEVKQVLFSYGISVFKNMVVKKRIAFEDEEWNNKEIECLEVRYKGSLPRLPPDLVGETFFKVYNTTATALERVLLECNINGPSDLIINNAIMKDVVENHTLTEYICNMEKMNNITVVEEAKNIPYYIRMMSFNVVTSQSNDKRENQIVMICGLYDCSASLEKINVEPKTLTKFCFLTKPPRVALPFDLNEKFNERGLKDVIVTKNESELISMFLNYIVKVDPDIYIGHDFSEQLSKLVSRMDKLNTHLWSRISRLKRTTKISKIGFSKSAQWELTAGRLVADSRTSAMELLKAKSFDLDDLVEQLFNIKRDSEFMNGDIERNYANSNRLASFVQKCVFDSWYAVKIVNKLDAVPLFAQITKIVGGVFSRTLMGGRAERNEYLLLHAFYRKGYLTPDKHQKMQHKALKGNDNDVKQAKKTTFTGGMVLDPIKGLYDTYIILLDFNSLYPSIIQEYNICFTTIPNCTKEPEDEENLPSIPKKNVNAGILPTEIRKLVESRRDVKRKIKYESVKSPKSDLKKKLEIKQMGLKLTANSMYGCLGFDASRFCAKSLAALVTYKGREILLRTKTFVENLGFSVIYGDTDSIMVNSKSNSLKDALKIANNIKNTINMHYKKLEIDLDGVYKKLLLLKKKKYAGLAVNPENEKEESRELKGLDIVRRDWSVLAKEVGNKIVDLIFLKDREELAYDIHTTLGDIRKQIQNNELPLSKFEILKQLNKNPSDYGETKSLPHVLLALRMNNNGLTHFKSGDVVKYIICDDGTNNSHSQRAYHKTEIEKDSKLKVDMDYYLKQQIYPVVSRLCEPIVETNPVQIAEALGIDSSGLKKRMLEDENELDNDDIDYEVNFDACDPFKFKCPNPDCMSEIEIREGVVKREDIVELTLQKCGKCETLFSENKGYLINCLISQLRRHIKNYCNSTYVCDDVCAYESRIAPYKMTKFGPSCLKCDNGIMKKKYSIKMLYDQQCFLRNIFCLSNELMEGKKLETIDETKCKEMYNQLYDIVERYLNMNAFNIVDLGFIFASSYA
uniref:DNA polymerase n=1 Tax=Parastrongyloides trichosuri TaxID=131310 RepID=A0A0N5A1W3_PARTI